VALLAQYASMANAFRSEGLDLQQLRDVSVWFGTAGETRAGGGGT
jgi:hypothetical protein